ncbi:hypothetical protein OROMI_008098 [Orobanche minor]
MLPLPSTVGGIISHGTDGELTPPVVAVLINHFAPSPGILRHLKSPTNPRLEIQRRIKAEEPDLCEPSNGVR